MTNFLLIRHAHCDPVGHSIAGRAAGVHLSAIGRREATALGERLKTLQITAVYSSPLERALETAAAVAAPQGLAVAVAPGLIEIDFGEWTGRSLTDLHQLPEWKLFNTFRSGTRIPGGETATEVLTRALAEVDRLRRDHQAPEDLVAVVSHGDVLKAIIAHFLGIPTDLYQRLELGPASASVLALNPWGPRLLLLNCTGEWPGDLGPPRKW